jgi:hypothetical protein
LENIVRRVFAFLVTSRDAHGDARPHQHIIS